MRVDAREQRRADTVMGILFVRYVGGVQGIAPFLGQPKVDDVHQAFVRGARGEHEVRRFDISVDVSTRVQVLYPRKL